MKIHKDKKFLSCALAVSLGMISAAYASDQKIRIEVEEFNYSEGTFPDGQSEPVSRYNIDAGEAINFVNRGDLVGYYVNVPEEGIYQVTYKIATATSQGAEIVLQVNDNGIWHNYAQLPVSASGWDTYYPLTSTAQIPLLAGENELRIIASGTADWQWNLDYLELSRVGPIDTPTEPVPPVEPPSGKEAIVVDGNFTLEAEWYQSNKGELSTYTTNGGTAVNYFNSGDYIEFYVDQQQPGIYSVSFDLATEHSTDVVAELYATNEANELKLVSSTSINSPYRDWDHYFNAPATSRFNLFAGVTTLRLVGAGSEDFQFNIDKLNFVREGEIDLSLDSDGDGIADITDQCPNSPRDEAADKSGCTASQKDSDDDGINDATDQCPNTPDSDFVDEVGCTSTGSDDNDLDGIPNVLDKCPDTPFGNNVDSNGCSLVVANDEDQDGVENARDICPNTPIDEIANKTGCSPSQLSIPHSVNVDIDANFRHSVNGVDDFGRSRHITMHSGIYEQDWNGHHDKLNYLLNTLDVHFGRDNGTATWRFNETLEDPNKANWPDLDWMVSRGETLRKLYQDNTFYQRFAHDKTELIAGTNPHPTYPTLSWYPNGMTNTGWQPKDIETSAAWMAQYLKHYYANSSNGYVGEPMPKYWEVINEPDMLLKTGQFMVSNQEAVWRYHALVAQQVREALGADAPLIGGMTWGQHDFYRRDGISRYADDNYDQWIDDENGKVLYRTAMTTDVDDTRDNDWYQWDVMWRGFMENSGDEMDFYSVHIYDWPHKDDANIAGVIRRGGHVQAMLDMMEWYDVNRNGIASRKPIVISEYGAVQGAWEPLAHDERYDIENLKAFNAMLMQFLQRPDYIIKSMPFTPAKPIWGYMPSGCAYDDSIACTAPYHYSMLLESELNNGDWQWSSYIKFFELWADIDGTRVRSQSSDIDIQVNAYVQDNELFIMLNNLEEYASEVNLGVFGISEDKVENVEMRHLYYDHNTETILHRHHSKVLPKRVQLAADGSMMLRVTFKQPVVVDQLVEEHKYFGESVSGGNVPHRISVSGGAKSLSVNHVDLPDGPAEAMVRLTVSLYPDADDIIDGLLTINSMHVNGHKVDTPIDWRGPAKNNAERIFTTLEIPVPVDVLKQDNQISVDFKHNGQLTATSIVIWDYSSQPQ